MQGKIMNEQRQRQEWIRWKTAESEVDTGEHDWSGGHCGQRGELDAKEKTRIRSTKDSNRSIGVVDAAVDVVGAVAGVVADSMTEALAMTACSDS
jgi:hypothetical protein